MTFGQSLMTVGGLMASLPIRQSRSSGSTVRASIPGTQTLAAAKMNAERSGHSWQPSLLIHEVYLQLINVKSLPEPDRPDSSDREHFLKFAGHVMRHLLIDHSRPLAARVTKIDIANFDVSDDGNSAAPVREIDDLLENLAAIHPRLRSIVEM